MYVPTNGQTLHLPRCPYCNIDLPTLQRRWVEALKDDRGNPSRWSAYACVRCAGVVIAKGEDTWGASEISPEPRGLPQDIPSPASDYLEQAINSLHSPAGSVMLCASAIDAMLKAKGYVEGSLYDRINKASKNHVLTADMATWSHQIRLDANDQRHADKAATLPTTEDASRSVEFALALGTILFTLPARVTRGIAASSV